MSITNVVQQVIATPAIEWHQAESDGTYRGRLADPSPWAESPVLILVSASHKRWQVIDNRPGYSSDILANGGGQLDVFVHVAAIAVEIAEDMGKPSLDPVAAAVAEGGYVLAYVRVVDPSDDDDDDITGRVEALDVIALRPLILGRHMAPGVVRSRLSQAEVTR